MARCDHGFETTVVPCPMGCGRTAKRAPTPFKRAIVPDALAEALRATDSIYQAAARLGCTAQGIRNVLKRSGSAELRALADEQTERRRQKRMFGKAAE
jgi:hypothetical protein